MTGFKKGQRLLTANDYRNVFSNAKKIDKNQIFLLIRRNNLGFSRLGLAISKKNVQKACQRNRIKRVVRESFRLSQLPGFDIIALSRKGVADLSNEQLRTKLCQSWQKLKTL